MKLPRLLRRAVPRAAGLCFAASLLADLAFVTSASAQTPASSAVRIDDLPGGGLGKFTHPYRARYVPPINLSNSSRLESLVRGGNLYLTAQDVVALAIENNIDVEIQRYGPLLQREVLRRALSGNALRQVGLGVAQGPQSVSLTGVSVNGNGIGSSGTGVNSGGGITTLLGPQIPSYDPTVSFFANFQHATSPQSNTFLVGLTALTQDSRSYQAQYSQNWSFGLNAQVTYASTYAKVNSPNFALNPYTTGDLDLQLTQNLLYGFGSAVNNREILVQKNNMKVTDLNFKQQLIATVSSVLNLYWDLVSFNEDLRSRQEETRTAQQLFDDNKKQVDLGSLAEIEITRAEAQLYAAKQDLVISQTNIMQQEIVLKNALSRRGVAVPELASVHIIPLDKMVIPEKDEFKPVETLVEQAMSQRPDMEQSRLNIKSKEVLLVGIKNSLKPNLQAFAEVTNNGLTGSPTALAEATGAPGYLAGGYGNLLAQIARRNFPNYSAGFSLNIPLRNRAAQSDYATSLLEIRQDELNLQKTTNQVRVDVQNAVIGLQQARARYDAAVKSRVLQEKTLDADQRKLNLGATTPFQVVQDQRDMANARSSEAQAMANYSHARVQFDQALGGTLDANHISVTAALAGSGGAASMLPTQLPAEAK
jgi:outer membrane protein